MNCQGVLSLKFSTPETDEVQTLRAMFAYEPPRRFRMKGYTLLLGEEVSDILMNEYGVFMALPPDMTVSPGAMTHLQRLLPELVSILWLSQPWTSLGRDMTAMRAKEGERLTRLVIPDKVRGGRYVAEFSSNSGRLLNIKKQRKVFWFIMPIYRTEFSVGFEAFGEFEELVYPAKARAVLGPITIDILMEQLQFNTELNPALFGFSR